MEIAKENRHRQEFDVAWLSSEEADKLDHFSIRKQEDELRPEQSSASVHIPSF